MNARPALSSQLTRSLILQAVDSGTVTVRALAKRLRLEPATVRMHTRAMVAGGHLRISALRVAGSSAHVFEVVRGVAL